MTEPGTALPNYAIPAEEELREARRQLGAQLRAGFAAAGMTDLTAIGKSVANTQIDPPREDIPFHPGVVQSWFDGKCLPSEETLETIQTMLADKTDQSWRDRTDQLLDVAIFNPQHVLHIYSADLAKSLHTDRSHLATEIADLSQGAYKSLTIHQLFAGFSYLANSTALHSSLKCLLHSTYGLGEHDAQTISDDIVALAHLNTALRGKSEIAATLDAYCREAKISSPKLGENLTPPVSGSMVRQWRSGSNPVPSNRLEQIDSVLKDHGVELAPGLLLLHHLHQRIEAEARWKDAAEKEDFGAMLQTCRQSLELSGEEMNEQLQQLGMKKISRVGVSLWELNKSLPSYRLFPVNDVVTTYGKMLSEHDAAQDPLLNENYGNFWTPERDQAMRAAFTKADQARSSMGLTRDNVYRSSAR